MKCMKKNKGRPKPKASNKPAPTLAQLELTARALGQAMEKAGGTINDWRNESRPWTDTVTISPPPKQPKPKVKRPYVRKAKPIPPSSRIDSIE